jgi:hypothetical protein
MKTAVLTKSLSIALSLLLATMPTYAAPPADHQIAGEVKALIPDASRNGQPVRVKDTLEWNDLLKTGAQGRLRAGLTAGSILSLGSNSELQVVQHDAVSQQTLLVVNYGKLRNQVAKITKADGKYEVRTPNAVIGVTGTDFYVGYADNQTTVICYSGTVAVTPTGEGKVVRKDEQSKKSGAAIILLAGQMVVIGPDVPAGGFLAAATPAALAHTSMEDTNVPDQMVAAEKPRSHKLRKGLLILATAGLGIGLGLAEVSGGRSNPNTVTTPPMPTVVDITNRGGSVTFTDSGLVSKGSVLSSFNGTAAPAHGSLGGFSFATGAFSGSSIWSGGTFANTGSALNITGFGDWAKTLTRQKTNIVPLFTGSFTGPAALTVVSQSHATYVFSLSGPVSGTYYTGQTVSGTTTQTIYAYTDQEPKDHKGSLHMGTTMLTIPAADAASASRAAAAAKATDRSKRQKAFGLRFVW